MSDACLLLFLIWLGYGNRQDQFHSLCGMFWRDLNCCLKSGKFYVKNEQKDYRMSVDG